MANQFVMIIPGLLGLRGDGQAVYMTIKYGQTVRYIWVGMSISITRIICLAIQRFLHHQ